MGSGQVLRRALCLILLTLSYSTFIQSAPTTSNSAQVPNTLLGVDHNERISIQTNKESRISSTENNDMTEESSSAGSRISGKESSLSSGVHPTSSSSQAIRSTSIQESLNEDPRFDFPMSRFTNPFIDYLEGNDSSEEQPMIKNEPKKLVSQVLIEVFESDRVQFSERDNPILIFLKMAIPEIKSAITITDENISDMEYSNTSEKYIEAEIQDANHTQANGVYIKDESPIALILEETDSEKSDVNDFDVQSVPNIPETSLSKSNDVEEKNWPIFHNIRHSRETVTTESTNTKLKENNLKSNSAKGPAIVFLRQNSSEVTNPIQRPYIPFVTNIGGKNKRNAEQLDSGKDYQSIFNHETLTPVTKYYLLIYRYPFENEFKQAALNDSETLVRFKRNSLIPPTEVSEISEETSKPPEAGSTIASIDIATTERSSQLTTNSDVKNSQTATIVDQASTVSEKFGTSTESNDNMEMSTSKSSQTILTSPEPEFNTLGSTTENDMNENGTLKSKVNNQKGVSTLESQSQNEPRSGDEDSIQFAYQVSDSPTHSFYSFREAQKEDVITGSYRILLPDGRTEIVNFTADDEGYHPSISMLPKKEPTS